MGNAAGVVDLDAARAAVRRSSERVAELMASAPDPAAPVPGMAWNVGEVAAHLALVSEAYTRYASGSTEAFVDVSDVAGGSLARTSAARLEAERERDLRALAARLRAGTESLLEQTRDRSAGDRVTWNGQPLDVGSLLGIAVGEYVLHGRDLARALGRDWSIDPDDARLVLASALPLLPLLVDPDATARADASYDLRVRGGRRVTVRVRRGSISVAPPGERVDCHVSADPVALLLVSYGRRSQWPYVLTGKLVAWGRKPWLGLRLTSYLVTP